MSDRTLPAALAVCCALALGGCASSPNVVKTYDPAADARLRVSMLTKFWKVTFNKACRTISYEPDLDVLDTAYRWDFSSNKTVGMPPGMKSPYDEFIVKAGMPVVISVFAGSATTEVNGFTRGVYVDDAVAMTMQPGSDYEAYLNTYGKIMVRRISYVNGVLQNETIDVPRAPNCPKWQRPKGKYAD